PGGPFSVVFRNGLGTRDISDTAFTFVTTGGTTASAASDASGGTVPVGTINNETQLITFGGTITGGTFTLNFNNYVTAAITFDPSAVTGPANNAAAIQSALLPLLTTGTGTLTVTAVSLFDYLVTFQGALGQRDVAQIGVTSNALAGTSPTIVTSTPFQGVAGETVGNLTLASAAGAAADLDTSAITLAPSNITVYDQSAADTGVTLSGGVDFAGTGRTLTINDGAAATDLLVAASFTGQTGAGLSFTGPGTTEYGGAAKYLYAGNTTFNEATLVLNKTPGPSIPGT